MGLLKHEIFDLLSLIKEKKCKSICMIGKQDVIAKWSEIERILIDLQIDYNEKMMQDLKKEIFVDSYKLFQVIGIKEIHAVDYSDYEGADIVFDLNKADVPDEYRNKFDLVINGGTLEHIFDIRAALRNMDALVKKTGYIYHMIPLAGWVDHGFYSFSPTFFLDYYTKNNWFIKTLQMHFINGQSISISPDCRFFTDFTDLNNYIAKNMQLGKALIQCFAQKKEDGIMQYPIQGMYENCYKKLPNIEMLIESLADEGKVAIYGIGSISKRILETKNFEKKVAYMFDSDKEKEGMFYKGISIQMPTKEKLDEVQKIIVSSTKYEAEIIEKLLKLGVGSEKIVSISDVMQ